MADQHEELSGELGSGGIVGLEHLLASFTPQAGSLSTGRLMFLAGREAGRREVSLVTRRAWPWMASTAAMILLATGLALLLAVRWQPQVHIVERRVYVPQPEDASAAGRDPSDMAPATTIAEDPLLSEPLESSKTHAGASLTASSKYLRARALALTAASRIGGGMQIHGSGPGQPAPTLRELREDLLSHAGDARPSESTQFDWNRLFPRGDSL